MLMKQNVNLILFKKCSSRNVNLILFKECSSRIFILILKFLIGIAKNEPNMQSTKFTDTPCIISQLVGFCFTLTGSRK